MDDGTHDPDQEEKDTRLKYGTQKKAGMTMLQRRMLEMAGQEIPEAEEEEDDREEDKDDRRSSSSSDSEDDEEFRKMRQRSKVSLIFFHFNPLLHTYSF